MSVAARSDRCSSIGDTFFQCIDIVWRKIVRRRRPLLQSWIFFITITCFAAVMRHEEGSPAEHGCVSCLYRRKGIAAENHVPDGARGWRGWRSLRDREWPPWIELARSRVCRWFSWHSRGFDWYGENKKSSELLSGLAVPSKMETDRRAVHQEPACREHAKEEQVGCEKKKNNNKFVPSSIYFNLQVISGFLTFEERRALERIERLWLQSRLPFLHVTNFRNVKIVLARFWNHLENYWFIIKK